MKRIIRGCLKGVLRVFGAGKAYSKIASGYIWGLTLLNLLLFRLSRLLPFVRVRAWPHALFVESTNICNADCVFCAYRSLKRKKQLMDLELFRTVVDQYAAMGGGEMDLTPVVGDPLADGKLFERLDHVHSKPEIRRFHFFTNAIAMRPELCERLLRYTDRFTVYVSLGGFDRETYRRVMGVDKFEAASGNLRALIERKRESGSPVNLQVNLRTPKSNNRGELWEHLLRAKKDGVIELTWMGAYDSWAGRIRDQDLLDAGLVPRPKPAKNGPCHRLLTSPLVLADGRVNACACRDVDASLIIGDLHSESLDRILRGEALRELVDRHARGDFPEVCERCTYYDSVYPRWLPGHKAPSDPCRPVEEEPPPADS